MAHRNYSKYSEKPSINNKTDFEVINEQIEEKDTITVEDAKIVEDENGQMVIEEVVIKPKTIINGVVSGCERLYVRNQSIRDSEVLCIIDEGTEVEIDNSRLSTEDFYPVIVNGIIGYCMKKFITIK